MSDARETVWVCGACGKRSRSPSPNDRISVGFDESCMLNCIECYADSLIINEHGRVTEVKEGGVVKEARDD